LGDQTPESVRSFLLQERISRQRSTRLANKRSPGAMKFEPERPRQIAQLVFTRLIIGRLLASRYGR